MKLRELHLTAFGPFTDRKLDFGSAGQNVVFVHGPNEAGKSSTLRAISDLRFGIPQLSRDNFVHEHRNMLLGGVLVDRNGKSYHIMRRKGRTNTLQYADGSPVTPDVEALITCGLSKEDYEAMFGLDHDRLRNGGEALLAGHGEIGAALFEASAGVRSIPSVLERLDQSARTYFMPGARAKNGRINEALRSYGEHHAELKTAQIKPAWWAERFKEHQSAAKRLAELEVRHEEANRRQLRLSELRGVAPLIRTQDEAGAMLSELDGVPLLAENAATERAAAQAGLAAACQNAQAAQDAVQRLSTQLKALAPDQAALDAAARIERLAASAESFESLRNTIADAADQVAEARRLLDERAGAILPGAAAHAVLALAPAPAARARIEEVLGDFKVAQQRLHQHLESALPLEDDEEHAADALPTPALVSALHAVRDEARRKEVLMKRKEQLPADIRQLERQVAADVAALGLADEVALTKVRALLDSEIDAARSEFDTADTELATLRKQLAQLKIEHAGAAARCEQLLAAGAVPTMTQVRAARGQRDGQWAQVREANAGGNPAPGTLLDSFEADVRDADRLVDELARDTERATQLQGSQDELARLAQQLADLEHERAATGQRSAAAQERWNATLAARGLPQLAPKALREWQSRLAEAREQGANLQALTDELDMARATERALVDDLCDAISAVGVAAPANGSLATLWSLVGEIENDIERRQHALSTALGKRTEREQHQRRFKAQQKTLEEQLAGAAAAVSSGVYGALHLDPQAGVAAAGARLLEFGRLGEAKAELDSVSARELRAQQAFERLLGQGHELAQAMGDTPSPDLRHYVEQLKARLAQARRIDSERALKQQALEEAQERQREQESLALRHEAVLERLCRAAEVDSPEALPAAEAQSQRKRQAQAEADRVRRDLATASSRPVDELRALLRDYDAERMNDEQNQVSAELATLEELLRSARQAEETARRALEAVDSADTAAVARELMERDAAGVRLAIAPWMRSRLAHALLDEALKRFRERAQGPMLLAASRYFQQMTDGLFVRLVSDDAGAKPVLLAQRDNGGQVRVEGLSEGTRDQLYLALRLAALEIRRDAGYDLPVVLDDVLMTSDDGRAALALRAIADFAKDHQVIVFTHHAHLLGVAERSVPAPMLQVVSL
ncbi:ATP-binding protein [Massilia pseudoviolaceinigra]|uniref:ATP-binding protein n=1 Tax=Massilia pseudoviolaceinigra TaxID=3057165 RepID=UPI00279679DF|nr:YhaN family protein [Massilia sp. CCM 9206]MDQ1919059.1 AAA family ATPase [Massilia sp. CCM 9206]